MGPILHQRVLHYISENKELNNFCSKEMFLVLAAELKKLALLEENQLLYLKSGSRKTDDS